MLVAALLPACGDAAPSAPAPPDIAYGRAICVECGMIISEPRYAAAYEIDGDDRIFDDIGDMLAHGLRTGELTLETPAWVHDHPSAEWLDAHLAWFVVDAGLATPMGHDIAAFADRAAADRLAADRGGRVHDWDQLIAELISTAHPH